MDGSENVKVPTGKLPFTVQLLSNQPARELFLCAETMLVKTRGREMAREIQLRSKGSTGKAQLDN